MKRLGFLNLRGISGQITLLVVASILAIHLIITAIFLIHRPDQIDASADRGHSQLAASVQLLGAAPESDRPRLRADIARTFPQLDIQDLAAVPPGATENPTSYDLWILRRRLSHNYKIFLLADEDGAHKVGIALPDGSMVSARLLRDQHRPFWSGPWMNSLLFAVVVLTLLGLWAARALTAPLSAFAKAAEDFSLDGAAPPLPERGPEEIRSVAKALNRMRQRITALIDDRTKMLAAISHDLPHADHADAAALGVHRG